MVGQNSGVYHHLQYSTTSSLVCSVIVVRSRQTVNLSNLLLKDLLI